MSTLRPTGLVDQHLRPIVRTDEPMSLRRWESAKTDRLNRGHWSGATDNSINFDLSMWAETLRKRAMHEAANNSLLAGVINTHVTDLVGARGPVLQVQSDNEDYNTALEGAWGQWWALPDLLGRLSGPQMLRMGFRMWWYAGEWIWQEVTEKAASGPVRMRLKAIHPRRLQTPATMTYSPLTALGITTDEHGRPQSYAIMRELPSGEIKYLSTDYDEVPARFVRHCFEQYEPDQMRGIPLVAATLHDIADLRDFDQQTMDAARAAADWSVLLYSALPPGEVPPITLGSDTIPMERRTMQALPPGYQAQQVKAEHPSTNYVQYRKEHQAGIGRPVNMPLMRVRLDASEYNYSSARLEAYIYEGGLDVHREVAEVQALNPTVRSFEIEAQLAGLIPERPPVVRYGWVWPALPTIDPLKEAEAERMEMENRTATFSEACARRGKDPDQVIAQHQRDREKFAGTGLPLPPSFQEPKPATTPGRPDNQPKPSPARVYEVGNAQ